tara:strand:+ start:604 stop:807 length:204 start_codon:yes stop_codon:yes gene_type:complete
MGRAIEHEKDIEKLKKDVKQLKTAFEGLASTVDTLKEASPRKKSVDLHETTTKKKVSKKRELVKQEA